MITTRTRVLFVLIVIAILSIMLSACSAEVGRDMVNLYASAHNDGTAPASHNTVQWNERNTCTIGSLQLVLNAIDADLQAAGMAELEMTTDEWLNAHMGEFRCIIAK